MFEDIRYCHEDQYSEYDFEDIGILIDWESGESYFMGLEEELCETFKSF